MTIQQARLWLTAYSLVACGITLLFFLIAPVTPYPLDWPGSFRILEIITPVFFGYLGLATRSLFDDRSRSEKIPQPSSPSLFTLLAVGPLVIFAIVTLALIVAFGLSNMGTVTQSKAMSAMSLDNLAAGLTAVLSLLTVTTNVIVSKVFAEKVDPQLSAVGEPQKLS